MYEDTLMIWRVYADEGSTSRDDGIVFLWKECLQELFQDEVNVLGWGEFVRVRAYLA